MFLDTPEANPAALALASRFRMTPTFETARMYKNGSPEMRLDRCFGMRASSWGREASQSHVCFAIGGKALSPPRGRLPHRHDLDPAARPLTAGQDLK